MGLLDEVRAEISTPGAGCSLVKVLAEHPTLAGEITECICNRKLPAAAIARVLRKREIDVAAATINRHRSNTCATCKAAGTTW